MTLNSPTKSAADRYLGEADRQAEKSTCLRRPVGAVLVTDIGGRHYGSTRPPAGHPDCMFCHMTSFGIPDPSRLDRCRGLHAEAEALLSAGMDDAEGAILYVAALDGPGGLYDPSWPCPACARLAAGAGIEAIVIATMRGPRMIAPEHLIRAHERGFSSALPPVPSAAHAFLHPVEPRAIDGPPNIAPISPGPLRRVPRVSNGGSPWSLGTYTRPFRDYVLHRTEGEA